MFWIPNLFRRFPSDMPMARVPGTTFLITTTTNNAAVVRIAADRRRRLQRAERDLADASSRSALHEERFVSAIRWTRLAFGNAKTVSIQYKQSLKIQGDFSN
jgi:hypothetical protein